MGAASGTEDTTALKIGSGTADTPSVSNTSPGVRARNVLLRFVHVFRVLFGLLVCVVETTAVPRLEVKTSFTASLSP